VQPLLCLLAYPVGGNPTQYLVERVFAHHDLDWRYLTFEVRPEDLGDAVRGLRALGFRGGHCAGPHKQAVLPLLDRTTETAAMIGSVNLMFRDGDSLVGENTEGRGVVEAIRTALALTPGPSPTAGEGRRGGLALTPGPSPETGEGSSSAGETPAPQSAPQPAAQGWAAGKQVVLLGAGQLARAVAVELAAAGAAGLTIVNRTEARAAELAAMLSEKFSLPASAAAWSGDYAVPPEADILIHATSLGHEDLDTPVPVAPESLRPEMLVADAAAGGPETWLLRQAAARGCKTLDGLSTFLEQVAVGLRLWTGVDPDRQVLREAAEEFLGL
jgi:shikimate dehydrogenase